MGMQEVGRGGEGGEVMAGRGLGWVLAALAVGNGGTGSITISSQRLREMNVELMLLTGMLLITVNILK